ncbi:MAG: 4'-phosphopantetheinyl transferase superfamily protein [Planctomycetota bacterium]
MLSESERKRAGDFKFEEGSLHFRTGRTLLRTWLGLHTGLEAPAIEFRYKPLGKPLLDNHGSGGLKFSYSHSGDYFVCSVVHESENGIDIERVRDFDDLGLTAQTMMNSQEYSEWLADSCDEKVDTFFQTWTRKESVGKVAGTGISTGPQNIPVPMQGFARGTAPIVPGLEQRVVLSDWSPFAGTASSVAVATDSANEGLCYSDEVWPGGETVETHSGSITIPDFCALTIRRFQ